MRADLGLLIMRVFIAGALLLGHGWGKLTGFSMIAERFPDPIGMGPTVSLALAVFAEVFCSVAVMFGFATRLAVIPLITTMLVALLVVHTEDPWNKKELAFMYFIPFVTLLFTGPGKFSIDGILGKTKRGR